jgi:starch phosphorylase
MTELALGASRAANGVSQRHGEATRMMFPGRPIDSVTNGVHHLTWTAPATRALFDNAIPGWREDPSRLAAAEALPDMDLTQAHLASKRALFAALRQLQPDAQLDEGCLLIGFARRFATYKRANLLFSDAERLARIAQRGLQVVVAGKAHPKDEAGKSIIQEVFNRSRAMPARVVFVEDYDLALGKLLTAGVDIWLNNPRRPLEASGTSGMKAALNGVPHLSVLDGWWVEGYDGTNGWVIGGDYLPTSESEEDSIDADSLYRLLEERIVPEFYDRQDEWLWRMKRAIVNSARFTTHRMVGEYARRAYRL